jgi:hypothetical protein
LHDAHGRADAATLRVRGDERFQDCLGVVAMAAVLIAKIVMAVAAAMIGVIVTVVLIAVIMALVAGCRHRVSCIDIASQQ